MLYVAAAPLNAAGEPAFAPSILNCTDPPGVPAPGATALNAIVKVTSWLGNDGFTDELTIPVVLAFVTVSVPLT